MRDHTHAWAYDPARNIYPCTCGVRGYRLARSIRAYLCQHELPNGHHYGAEATHGNALRNSNRCDEHAARVSTRRAS